MNKFLSVLVGLVVLTGATARADQPEPTPWKVDVSTGIVTTQSSYSDNWTGGEAGSINWVAFYNSTTKRQLNPNWYTQFDWKLSFGQTHIQQKETKDWQSPTKSEDKIRYDAILKLTKGWFADPYAAFTFESQFLDASSPFTSRYINPIELTESSGLARTLVNVPDKTMLTTRLGLGLRQRIVRFDDPADTLSVEPGTLSETTVDGGIEWVTDLLLGSAASKYSFDSKLTLFQALFNSKSDELPNDYWKTADANWDNILRMKVSSLINVGLNWQLLYDKEIDLGGRFKQSLSVGIVYTFANYEEEKK
ncbi:MAG: DUF3078 domain-containing protein [Calditrichaeota bacterium]|nr:DUF3078 domain-containing protein [Calditrichota bacterium]MCB9365667.1 DUF3078 domain-containing protein [Calditrichota bacterium]MCB9391954.1 DUF3078 domain-containing protein [Calditrichota bacterium]